MRKLIKEQLQAKVQEKIKEIVNSSLTADCEYIETKSGKVFIYNMVLKLRDIKFEPGEMRVYLVLESGGYRSEHWEIDEPNRSLMDGHLVFRYWFKEKFSKLKYYNVNQTTIVIGGEGKSVAIHVPPLKPPQSLGHQG